MPPTSILRNPMLRCTTSSRRIMGSLATTLPRSLMLTNGTNNPSQPAAAAAANCSSTRKRAATTRSISSSSSAAPSAKGCFLHHNPAGLSTAKTNGNDNHSHSCSIPSAGKVSSLSWSSLPSTTATTSSTRILLLRHLSTTSCAEGDDENDDDGA